jgi:uncharacterized repeat protein (TIGR01451 family)
LVEVGPYPIEASFYPEHIIIPLISLLVFVAILSVIAHIRKRLIEANLLTESKRAKDSISASPLSHSMTGTKITEESGTGLVKVLLDIKHDFYHQLQHLRKDSENMNPSFFKASESISLVTLIATVVLALVGPFGQLPILDYSISDPISSGENQTYDIKVENYGTVTAKNVMISLQAQGVKFQDFGSTPYLANQLIFNKSIQGTLEDKAMVEINQLHAHSSTVIHAITKPPISDSDAKLTVYLRSEQVAGYHNIGNLIAFYAILAIFYAIFALSFSTKKINPLYEKNEDGKTVRKINYSRIAIIAISIACSIISANLLFLLSHLDSSSLYYLVSYWAGLLIIPLTIFVISVLYYFVSKREDKQVYQNCAVITGIIISIIFAAGLATYMPRIDTGYRTSRVLYFVSILSVPATIVIAFVTYGRKAEAAVIAAGMFAIGLLILW